MSETQAITDWPELTDDDLRWIATIVATGVFHGAEKRATVGTIMHAIHTREVIPGRLIVLFREAIGRAKAEAHEDGWALDNVVFGLFDEIEQEMREERIIR